MQLPLLKDANVKGKTVFLRADLDVPLAEAKSDPFDKPRTSKRKVKSIEDDTRLKAALPTIEYLLRKNAKVIIAGHLGRPKGVDKSLSLEPIAKWFLKEFKIRNLKFEFKLEIENLKLKKIGEFEGWEIGKNIFLLENLRFFEGEEKNDPEFAKKLADLADIYVNDAFAMCHRSHASIVGITKFLPHFAGFHLKEEVSHLTRAMENPKRPLVVIIGGKKIETKLSLVEKMHRIADYVLVGGKIAQESKILAKIQHEKIAGKKAVLMVADLTPDGTGITEKDLYNFLEIISLAKTIIWNGSMGLLGEKEDQFSATRKIAEGIIQSRAYSVVGGGDTVEFLNRIKLIDKFSFASTGGGSMLAFLSGEKLPGLAVLEKT